MEPFEDSPIGARAPAPSTMPSRATVRSVNDRVTEMRSILADLLTQLDREAAAAAEPWLDVRLGKALKQPANAALAEELQGFLSAAGEARLVAVPTQLRPARRPGPPVARLFVGLALDGRWEDDLSRENRRALADASVPRFAIALVPPGAAPDFAGAVGVAVPIDAGVVGAAVPAGAVSRAIRTDLWDAADLVRVVDELDRVWRAGASPAPTPYAAALRRLWQV